MRLAFLCSSLESGQDGVGDYTRRLAAECIRQGHPCVIVGLNDTRIINTTYGSQEMDDAVIPVLRLASAEPWSKRIVEARNWLDAFNPDWLSLQFVPFGYHRKGLCLGLGNRLAAINSSKKWHIMFHELWLGLGEKSTAKHRILGALQRTIVQELIGRLKPRLMHAQAEPYIKVLSGGKGGASLLPLFSNVPYVKGDGWTSLLEPLVGKAIGNRPDRTQLYLAGVFGAVHPEWNAGQAVRAVLPLVQRFHKRLVLVFLGKSNLTTEAFSRLQLALRNQADVVMTGERTNLEISKILQTLDLGLATSPRQIIQKSGSAAAMLEHGLQLLVSRDDWHLRGADSQQTEIFSQSISPREFGLLEALPKRDVRPPAESGVKRVADKMLLAMNSP